MWLSAFGRPHPGYPRVRGPAQDVLGEISELGIDYREVTDELERQGVQKFAAGWDELAGTGLGAGTISPAFARVVVRNVIEASNPFARA